MVPSRLTNVHVRRLYWQCRRGLLELDLLFIPFLEEIYPHLGGEEQKQFEVLLNAPDPQLLSWCLGRETPGEALAGIVDKVREHAKACHQN